jgi:hypothetical protein
MQLKWEFIVDEIGTDQIGMNGVEIESRSHHKDSAMDKKVGFPTLLLLRMPISCTVSLLEGPVQESFILSTRLLWNGFQSAKRLLKVPPMVPNLLLLALPLKKSWTFGILYS